MASRKVAVVTAGGSGMGAGAARKLAKDGFIGVTGSNQSNDDLERLVDRTVAEWGRIDVLVNSAGHGPRAPLLDLTDEDRHRGMEVQLLNVVRPARLVTPVMQKRRAGGRDHQHLDRRRLRAGSGVPDLGRVPRRARGLRQAVRGSVRGREHPHEQRAPRLHRQPAGEGGIPRPHPDGRYGRTDEVSALIGFLASDGAGYITGQNLRVDGGITRHVRWETNDLLASVDARQEQVAGRPSWS